MEAQLLRRPATCCLASSSSSSFSLSSGVTRTRPLIPLTSRRHKASASRTKRALNIAPHPSFLTSSTGGGSVADHVIFNPPAAEPSVFHTPFKFLPKSDPRRRDNLPFLFNNANNANTTSTATSTSPTSSSTPEGGEDNSSSGSLPPLADKKKLSGQQPFARITAADVAEIRRLRAADPEANSVSALARRFGCAKIFVMMCCHAPRAHQERRRAEEEAVRERWGPRRAGAREERKRRLEMLFKGEL